jgi:hypothetical protein
MTDATSSRLSVVEPVARSAFHKGAIALNNAAVLLLLRGFATEACDTLEDAMQLMECAALDMHRSTGSNHSMTANKSSSAQIQGALNRVCQRTSQCHKSSPHSMGTAVSSSHRTSDWPTLQVVSSQCNPSRIYERLTSCMDSASLHVAFPMTIDPIDFEGSLCKANDVYLEAAIMAYNYGIATFCQAHQVTLSATTTAVGQDSSEQSALDAQTTTSPMYASTVSQSPLQTETTLSARSLPSHTTSQTTDTIAAPDLALKAHCVFQRVVGTLAQIRFEDDAVDSESMDTTPVTSPLDTATLLTLSCQIVLVRLVLNHTLLNIAIALQWDTEYYTYSLAMHQLLRTIEDHQHYYCPLDDATAGAAAA